MTLFAETELDRQPRRRRPPRAGWLVLIFAILAITVVAFLPAPYVVQQPGPVFDTLGSVQFGGEEVALIQIDEEETFPTDGTLVDAHGAGHRQSRGTALVD